MISHAWVSLKNIFETKKGLAMRSFKIINRIVMTADLFFDVLFSVIESDGIALNNAFLMAGY